MLQSEFIFFELVTNTSEQIENLYELLKGRDFSISHKNLPSYSDHEKFVKNAPYRFWYIIKYSDEIIGSFYLKWDNSIGINFNKADKNLVIKIISYVRSSFQPMPEVPSFIPNYFYLNVSAHNQNLIDIIDQLGEERLQVSYKL